MNIIIFTANALRHKFLANTLAHEADKTLVVVECRPNDAAEIETADAAAVTFKERHFRERYETEREYFGNHNILHSPSLPLLQGEANLSYICGVIKNFRPDAVFVFGASLLKEQLLFLFPKDRAVNLHLGLSPYYRGAGTNFWPFVNDELYYVGSTILHIDAGVDTGDIITHVRPRLVAKDTVHTAGCKVITESVLMLKEIVKRLTAGETLSRVPQWEVKNSRYYRKRDFTEEVLERYHENMRQGMMKRFVSSVQPPVDLIQPFGA